MEKQQIIMHSYRYRISIVRTGDHHLVRKRTILASTGTMNFMLTLGLFDDAMPGANIILVVFLGHPLPLLHLTHNHIYDILSINTSYR